MTGWKSVSEPKKRRRLRRGGALAALVAAAILLPAGDRLRRPLFDAWQRLSPRDLADTRVRVVLIDAASLKALGMWPWPRFYLARLTDELTRRGVAAIGYDVLLAEPDRAGPAQFAALYPELSAAAAAELAGLESPDAAFARALGEAPAVLARAGTQDAQGSATQTVEARLPPALPAGFRRFPRAVTAIDAIDDLAAGHGLINAEPDADGVFRTVPLLATVGETPTPGFAAEVARIALKATAIGLKDGDVLLGGRALKADGHGELRLRFGHFPRARMISAVDLLRRGGRFRLAGTAVLIGPAAEGTTDIVTTPLAARQYGVLVQALALDAMLRGSGWLERPRLAWAAEWLAAALLAALALWLLPRRGRARLVLPAAVAGSAALAWLLFDRWSLLFDPFPAVLLPTSAAIGIGIAAAAETRRERQRLRATLVEERIAAAANEAELSAARSIQQAMLPRPEQLAALDPRLTVAALLEPARSVGGDFFDVVELGSGQLAFVIADVTGKGVSAALFMALSKALAKSALLRVDLPSLAPTIQAELSREAPAEMGLTLLVVVVDPASGAARLVNAGHENPFVLHADGSLEEVALEGGPPLCIVDYPWPVEPLRLGCGDTLLLVTDGVTEAEDPDGRFFGRDRLIAALREAGPDGPEALVTRLLARVRAFERSSEASDDVTLLAIRRNG